MRAVVFVAADLLREAVSRRWFFALIAAITLLVALLGATLKLEIVDGALAATSFFGRSVRHDIRAADLALRPVFRAATYLIFYGGILFGNLACSDFAPELLAPGRVEHVLSLPVRRVEVVLGTFVGVLALALGGTLYGALGFTLVLCIKSEVWSLLPVVGALLACVAFSAIYGVMLATAVLARSAALSAAAGGATFVIGILASFRSDLATMLHGAFSPVFLFVTSPFPRFANLATLAGELATGGAVDANGAARLIVGTLTFALACVALAAWEFERRDY